jgi:hypothetical protein
MPEYILKTSRYVPLRNSLVTDPSLQEAMRAGFRSGWRFANLIVIVQC